MRRKILTSELIDCTGAPPKENWALLVEDGLITEMGPAEQLNAAEAETVDLTDGVVTAGFIDMHTHFLYTNEAEFQSSVLQPNRVWMMERGLRNAEEWLFEGVTTAKSLGTPFDLDLELRDVLDKHPEAGPRLFCSGRMMTMVGGKRTPWDFMKEEVNGAEEARRFARTHLGRDVDLIKFYCTTLLEKNVADYLTRVLALPEGAPDPGRWSSLTEGEIAAVCEEVHQVGRTVSAHVAPAFGIKIALRGGVDTIEHGSDLDEECIDLFLETGATLVPTLNVTYYQIANSESIDAPPVYTEFSEKRWTKQMGLLKKAYQAGVKIATGTDDVIEGMQYYPEMELLVNEVGMSPMDALLCGTRNGAAAMRKAGEQLGTLEPGKYADLVHLAESPLEDISNIRKIKAVLKGGEVVAQPSENDERGKVGHRG